MNDFFVEFLRSLLALGIVLIVVIITLPYLLRFLSILKIQTHVGDSRVKINKVIPLHRKGSLVEMEVKNTYYVVYFTDTSATIIHREENEEDNTKSTAS